MTTALQKSSKIRDMQTRMAEQGIVLNAQMTKMMQDMKLDPAKHFYSVGGYKNEKGEWQKKLEPTAYLLQTMATEQKINTKIVSKVWENADNLLNAAVSIRIIGWKGLESNPEIQKEADIRLSMRTIAQRYVADKLTPKKGYQDKPGKPAEWTPEDVTLDDNGWFQPVSIDKKVAMYSYLADQLNFLDRNAETKAERRLNMKLLGFEWREGEEIVDEQKEVEVVNKEVVKEESPVFTKLKDKMERVRSASGMEKIKDELNHPELTKENQAELIAIYAKKKVEFEKDNEPKEDAVQTAVDVFSDAEKQEIEAKEGTTTQA